MISTEFNTVLSLTKDQDIFKKMMFKMRMMENKEVSANQIQSRKHIKQRMKKNVWEILFWKLKMVINLKAVSGLCYIMVALKKIDIVKKIFIVEIEDGNEVYIPKELSQDHYPASYRYYDSLISMTQTGISESKK